MRIVEFEYEYMPCSTHEVNSRSRSYVSLEEVGEWLVLKVPLYLSTSHANNGLPTSAIAMLELTPFNS